MKRDNDNPTRLPTGLHFVPMQRKYAEQIVTWHYPGYPVFHASPHEAEFEVKVLLEPRYRYYAGLDQNGEIVGFCCFGEDARVPGGDYQDDEALDVGLGLRPDLIGKRLGLAFLQQVLALGEAEFAPPRFRATIAVFNAASRRIFEQAGFTQAQHFESTSARPLAFIVFVKSTPIGSETAPR